MNDRKTNQVAVIGFSSIRPNATETPSVGCGI
jgi:hypothetical protein